MQAVSGSSVRLTRSEEKLSLFDKINTLYHIVKSTPGESHYRRFEKAFRGLVQEIHLSHRGARPDWFMTGCIPREWLTPIDSDGCTLLLRALRDAQSGTFWSRYLATHVPKDLLLHRNHAGDTAFFYAGCFQALGTLRILVRRQPHLACNEVDLLLSSIRHREDLGKRTSVLRLLERWPKIVWQDRDRQGEAVLNLIWKQWRKSMPPPPDRLAESDDQGNSLPIFIERLPPDLLKLSLFFDRQSHSYDYESSTSRPNA